MTVDNEERIVEVSAEFRRELIGYLLPEERWGIDHQSNLAGGIILYTTTDLVTPRKLIFVRRRDQK